MSLDVTVLFGEPQHALAPVLRQALVDCVEVQIVTGFATVEGIEAIAPVIRSSPGKLTTFVIGAATYRGFEALDTLVQAGVGLNRLFVHLGHTRDTGQNTKVSFYRYHPMLHSKVYYLKMSEEDAVAFIGSHNATGFALHGLNGEAGVFLRGPASDPEMTKVRDHIAAARHQAVRYAPHHKEAYAWWTRTYIDGLRAKANDLPKDAESKRTIVILAAELDGDPPVSDEVIYFELPAALNKIWTIGDEVHVYVFDKLPPTPLDGLAALSKARTSLWCSTIGLETFEGGRELDAQWQIQNPMRPSLRRTPQPFRPPVPQGMVQVRVRVRNEVWKKYEYLFDGCPEWEPEYNEAASIRAPEADRRTLTALRLIWPEDKEWYLVSGLRPVESDEPGDQTAFRAALKASAPESGSYILMSTRRRLIDERRQR